MFCDLNVPWPVQAQSSAPSMSKKAKKLAQKAATSEDIVDEQQNALDALSPSEKKRISEITYELMEMGYTTVAYNYIVHTKYDPAIQKNPFSGTPPFPKLDPRTRKSYGVESYREGIKQLTRLTVVLDNDQAIKSGSGFVSANALALQRYDLLSVTPTTEMAFQHACITLSELKPFSVDIISLDLAVAPRLPFHLKRSTVGAALSNGVVFEITYGAAIDAKSSSLSSKSTSEMSDLSDARRNLFSGAREILRVTNGKGVILSSQAMDAMGLRAPYDVMNLYVRRTT
ncbi:hypothetical protein MGL_2180 [Malassezia globosa CBS 7966]|uniref:Uncharacterized protein n=1 Tax=Malassezia globosa (strain ATCC MYA-4612 / CBS 7966) TaxID=425265 RepID=A8Q2A7_MALGO|nr:uncharacterized protein MGL_2180 [Malassezia globosa CBS 7966]EDP43512.1 hypothetical protein MGL_2180 [Malassezia globosa CBS 7966]